MPEYRGVVKRTLYANLATIADNKKQATQQLREIAELLLPTDYDFAEPFTLYVSTYSSGRSSGELSQNTFRRDGGVSK